MSSKILSGGAGPVERLAWTTAARTPSSSGSASSAGGSAEERLARLEAEMAGRIEEARAAGFREGEGAGETKARAALEAAIRQFSEAAGELASLRPGLRREAERDVARLSLAVARKILRRELSVDPQAILGIVKAAVEQIDAGDVHRIRANPQDAQVITQHLAHLGLAASVELRPDPTLERGAVILDTTRGSLDASVEAQLEEIEHGFADLLGRR